MYKVLSTLPIAALCFTAPLTQAQQNGQNNNVNDQAAPQRFWEAKVPGGSYMVALSRISSVSMHSYSVKGGVVHEVAVETMGSALTRFYAIELAGENSTNVTANIMNRARELASEAGDKVGLDTDTTVHKEYPVTTHAKTIEYRVIDQDDLEEIYKSITKAWKDNRGRKITIK